MSETGPVGAAIGGAASSGVGAVGRFAPAITAAAALAAALAGLAAAVRHTTQFLTEFARLQTTLGSTSGQAVMLKVLSGALGLGDPEAFAASIRQNSLGGMGAAAAGRLGLPISPLDTGNAMNTGALGIQFLEALRKFSAENGPEKTLTLARNLGHPEAAQAQFISKEVWEQIKRDAAEVQALLGPRFQTDIVELNARLELLTQKWKFLGAVFLTAVIPQLNKLTDWILGILRLLARIPGSGVNQTDIDAALKALNANTSAQNANTRQIEMMMGIWGGGPRARGAIPGAFGPGNGFYLSDAVRAGTLRLGAMAVSL